MGATNRKENSMGSVMPVSIQVSAAESSRPPAAFFFSGLAQRYMARAAPGRPKIMKMNSPEKYRVASALKWATLEEASCAKKIFCPPWIRLPSTIIVPPTAVCQKGR